ncbi:MAG: ISKra4 family transposase [Egibacteraceae bacterium]
MRAAMLELGGSLLEGLLAADRGHRGTRIDCRAGHQGVFVGYRSKTLDTVLGAVRLDRAYYHCVECGHGPVPRDRELGVVGASLSPGLQRMVARVGAAEPFAKARDDLAELAGVELSVKRIERSAEADGQTLAAALDAEADAMLDATVAPLTPARHTHAPDILYVAMDGTGVPCAPAATDGRVGKHPDGRARTREVKLGCVFTQSGLDDTGRPLRDADSTSYITTLAPAERFGALVYAEARRRGITHAKRLAVLGDAAPWIWKLAALHFPDAIEIVDLYHAREHLHALGALAAPTLGSDHPDWLTDRLAELDAGDIPAMLGAARALTPPETESRQLDKALGYFETNQHRMRYAHFRQSGLFVGSGAVEAGCRAVVAQRLKLSGMRWSVPGATGILALRSHQASGRWDDIWTRLHSHTNVA